MNAKANNIIKYIAQGLYEKLYTAAKKSKTRRFHILYDKICNLSTLRNAWETVKDNRGSPGIDGETIGDIKKNSEKILKEIQIELIEETYRPRALRKVNIPKSDGGIRTLSIPTVRDRIVQTAIKSIIEPIFEADFLNNSFGFRPKRNAHQALEEIRRWTNRGYRIVLDADISKCFDRLSIEILMELIKQRINDRKTLKCIKAMLKKGVLRNGIQEDIGKGVPQGGPLSPLLANIYLHEIDKFWENQKYINGKLIRYADDFVILFKTEKDAYLGYKWIKAKLRDLGLTMNENKTSIIDISKGKEGFDFLGFHHRRKISPQYRRYYTYKWPCKKAMKALKQKIRDLIGRRSILHYSLEDIVEILNPVLKGWMNYFKYGNSTKKFLEIDSYVRERMALFWRKKRQNSGRGWKHDYVWSKHRATGIHILRGNTKYWSESSNAQDKLGLQPNLYCP